MTDLAGRRRASTDGTAAQTDEQRQGSRPAQRAARLAHVRGAEPLAPERPTVVVANPEARLRRSVKDVLQPAGFVIVGEAASGREAIELTLHYRPDVLLIDVVMPDRSGIEVIRRLRAAGVAVPTVVLTPRRDDDETAILALRAGASGYLSSRSSLQSLPRTLRAVCAGELAISRRLGRRLVDGLRAAPTGMIGVRPVRSPLTPREWEVLDLLCEGLSTDQIAREFVLSVETIRSHIKNILRKLGVNSRAEAVSLADRLRMPVAD